MDEIMGGKVLDLPSDQLREERRKGIEQGIGVLIETCREVGVRQADTAAKLKSKFSLPDELIEEYMAKYWG